MFLGLSLGLDKMPDHFWQLASLLIGAELDAEDNCVAA